MGAGPGGTHTAVAPTIGHEAAPVAPSPKREKPGEAWFYSSSPSSSQGGGMCLVVPSSPASNPALRSVSDSLSGSLGVSLSGCTGLAAE